MMIYSQTVSLFIARVRSYAKEIINHEMKLNMNKSRILFKGISYPLQIVVFEDPKRLGYFDYRIFEIGLSKKLMYLAHETVLKNIIRHELAHFYCYLTFGPTILHGKEFHDLCKNFGWGPDVYLGHANLEIENQKYDEDPEEKTEKLLSRIKKLMALTSSNNIHESELATLKANQLLLEHNLDLNKMSKNQEETVYVKRVIEGKRKSAKHVAIYDILKTFFVSPVFNSGPGLFYIEVIGDQTSVILAEYMAHFLERELDLLWKKASKSNPLFKGRSDQNSFYKGVAYGYVQKIEDQKTKLATGHELISINHQLQKNLEMVYPKLNSFRLSNGNFNPAAHQEGIINGKNLSIHPGLDQSQSSQIYQLN